MSELNFTTEITVLLGEVRGKLVIIFVLWRWFFERQIYELSCFYCAHQLSFEFQLL